MRIKYFFLFLGMSVLSACGGGSDSGGGGSNVNDGFYGGIQTITSDDFSGLGLQYGFSATITGGNLRITDLQPPESLLLITGISAGSTSVPISSGQFSINATIVGGNDVYDCVGTIIYAGTVAEGTIVGSIDGNYACESDDEDLGAAFNIVLVGSFSATRES